MTPERWQLIEDILDAALELPVDARAAFLHEHCAGDPDLRTDVARILAAGEQPTPLPATPASFAASLLAGLAPGAGADVAPARERIGAYRIVRELGHGGMGAVYLAERDDEHYHKQVAIKVLRHGMGTGQLPDRFRNERQILAGLEHANIARLLDGGVSDGAPYIVMEYVEGLPLDRYCEEHHAALAERLRLFCDVCSAVQYAHQNLIVHRDLKPSNILVTAAGEVKLLDFGIAKLLDDPGGTDAPLTRTGVHVMTPEYAAPEQVRGGAVTTATDVYALGVILYQLLTGQPPYELMGRSLSEIERVVCQTDPPRPSTAARRRQRGRTAADREKRPVAQADQERLRRRLRGDLDTIVMKALQKDAQRRYPSAAALLEDLRRYQQGRPVRARPDTPAYRTRKFVLRHKVAAGAGLVLTALIFGFALRESQLRRQAESAAQRAEAVRDYLVSVFEVSDPFSTGVDRGEDVSARTLLDRGAQRVDVSLRDQPEARADMLGVLGGVYVNLGLLAQAEPLLERALELNGSLYGERSVEVAAALDALGELFMNQGRLDEAEDVVRRSLTLRRTLLGNQHPLVARSLDRLATVLQEKSAYAEAAPLFREALAIRERVLGPDHTDVARSLNNLALLHFSLAEHDAAEPLYRRAVAINRKALGDQHAVTSINMQNLATLLHQQGEWAEAEAVFVESLAMKRRIFGDAHPRVTVHLNNLAALLRDMGRLDEAEAYAREALMLDLQIFDEDHPYVIASRSRLATVLMDRGLLAEAEQTWRLVLESATRVHGTEHIRVLQAHDGLGAVRYRAGDLIRAEAAYREAHTLARRLFADDNLWTISVSVALGRVLEAAGRAAAAEPIMRAAVEQTATVQGALRSPAISARVGLGLVLVGNGRANDAEPLLHEALQLSTETNGEDHWRTADAKLALGTLLMRQQRFAEAEPLLQQAHDALRASPIRLPWLTDQSSSALAALATARGPL
jgi:eukaryotic-like serine/threonine-protein kinase